MEGLKTLIFGSTGFIGSNMLRLFLERGDEMHLCLRKNSDTWRIKDLLREVNLHIGDLSSYSRVSSILLDVKPDIVINCAGIVRGFDIDDQYGVIQSNFTNTVNLVNVCAELNVGYMINTGSAYECGYSNKPISQNKCRGPPIGLYGITKKAEREYIEMIARKYNMNYVTARLFTPFGPYDNTVRLIPYVITSLINDINPVINKPNSGRDFIFIEDVAKIFYELTRNPEISEKRSTFNIGSGNLVRVKDVVRVLYEIAGVTYVEPEIRGDESSELLYAERKEVDDLLSKLTVNVLPLKSGLMKTFDWFRRNRTFYRGTDVKKGEAGIGI